MVSQDESVRSAPCLVTVFEGKLLRVLRGFVDQGPWDAVIPLLLERSRRPARLSRNCVDLARESLAVGTMLFLVRAGGWQRDRFLRDGEPRRGRLWERTLPEDLALEFSGQTLEFLVWMTAHRPGSTQPPLTLDLAPLTPADRVFLLQAYMHLRETEFHRFAQCIPACLFDGLMRLAFVEDFVTVSEAVQPDCAPWLQGVGAAYLEALAPWLERRWIQIEARKPHIGDWNALRDLGLAQDRILSLWIDAAERAQRPDLIRFLVRAARHVLPPGVALDRFVGGLQGQGPDRLADRLAVIRAALALPRAIERLHQWQRRARAVGFFEDAYRRNQFWIAEWDECEGDLLAERARGLVRQSEFLNFPANERHADGVGAEEAS